MGLMLNAYNLITKVSLISVFVCSNSCLEIGHFRLQEIQKRARNLKPTFPSALQKNLSIQLAVTTQDHMYMAKGIMFSRVKTFDTRMYLEH